MKLLPFFFGLGFSSRSKQILEDHLNDKSLPGLPQTAFTDIQDGDAFTFQVELLKSTHENFVLVSSANGVDWNTGEGYNYIANVRSSGAELYDAQYEDNITFTPLVNGKFEVSIANETGNKSYMVIAFGDVMEETIDPELSTKIYRANVYEGGVDLEYHVVDGSPVLTCSAQASGTANIKFTTGLTTERDGNTIRAVQPDEAWFSVNRDTTWIECSTPFASEKVLRFKDWTDVKHESKPVLAGWTLSHTCGPVPTNADSVRLLAGNQFERDFLQFSLDAGDNKKDNVVMSHEGDNLTFTGLKAVSDMKAAVTCSFFNGEQLIGFTTPTGYEVFDEPTPRLPVTATLNVPKCGLDLSADSQEVGVCSHIENGLSFPPTLLQWQVTTSDGSVRLFPDEPTETAHLPLVLPLTDDLIGATAKCIDSRFGTDSAPEETIPTTPNFTFRQFTSMIKIRVEGDQIDCESDVFPNDDDECTDVQNKEYPDLISCPSAMQTPLNATCIFTMKNGSELRSATYVNENCIVNIEQLPCDKSSVDDCPEASPPKKEELNEGGFSLLWLFFFVFAAVGGGVLIFLNKRKVKADYSVTETDEPETSVIRQDEAHDPSEEVKLTTGNGVESSEEHVKEIDETPQKE